MSSEICYQTPNSVPVPGMVCYTKQKSNSKWHTQSLNQFLGSIVCNGFSGGSMAFEENGVYYIRGIVSSAISAQYGVCNPNEYVIFTDVARYLHWIKQVADHFAV